MDWTQLLSPGRLGCENAPVPAQLRSDAQRDYDRIVFSPPFRRLQGKTQIFPLPESDMTHNRLTHSLEVSCVGRSLGWIAAEKLGLVDEQATIAASVAAACLAHDLGNPPFGHSGESAIGYYFEAADGAASRILPQLTELQRLELTKFEGNALGFRLLTNQKPYQTSNPGGFSLTHLTLGAFSKYPCRADKIDADQGVHRKKYGVFHDDWENFVTVANGLGMLECGSGAFKRHPLAFLTEAADDICYRIVDFEDGFKLGLIREEEATEIFTAIASEIEQDMSGLDRINAADQRIGYLRAKAINSLVVQAVDLFVDQASDILEGSRKKPLLNDVGPREVLGRLAKDSRERIYRHKPVVEIEAAGFEVLPALLEAFLPGAALGDTSARALKLLDLMPGQYLPRPGGETFDTATQVLNVCEFVASMTDDYAISLFRKIRGISLRNHAY